jgi:hypothetical protein
MKNIHALAIMAMMYNVELSSERGKNNLRPEDIDMTPKKKIIPKGCKIFNINGEEIVAINEKSAQRKYRSILKKSSPDQVK